MDFIEIAERIRARYKEKGYESLANEISECLMQGGTRGERLLILANWLKKLKMTNLEKYQITSEDSELILEGATKYFL